MLGGVDRALMVADEGLEGLGQSLQKRVLAPFGGEEDLGVAQGLGVLPGGGGAQVAGEHLQGEARGQHRHSDLEGRGQDLADLVLHMELGAGLAVVRAGVVGTSPDEHAGQVLGPERRGQVQLLQARMPQTLVLQPALEEEGLVLLLGGFGLGSGGHHDEGLHPLTLRRARPRGRPVPADQRRAGAPGARGAVQLPPISTIFFRQRFNRTVLF